MVRKQVWLVVVCWCGLLAGLSAQTSTSRVAWDQGEPVALAQANSYTLKVDAAAAVALVTTCMGDAASSKCSAPLPVTLTAGTHTLIVTAINGFGSTPSLPLVGAPPARPTNVTLTITLTVP